MLFINVNVPLAVVYAVAPDVKKLLVPRRIPGLRVVSVNVGPGLVTVEVST